MRDIKRVLWVDDHPDIEVTRLFRADETTKVRLMADAVKEISSTHLYDYDTIVFDIDFGNGLPDPDEVISELSKRIYLDPSQKKNEFIINNGGYLLFVYLLERGYPSDQVAFLTGNPAMLEILRDYSRRNSKDFSKVEIAAAYKNAWDSARSASKEEDAWEYFIHTVESFPFSLEYISEDAIIECSGFLEKEDYTGLENYIDNIDSKESSGNTVQNTGDLMIYRFHNANLEPPDFFTKRDFFIRGHDKGDAARWLEKNRTKENVTRWLILSAGYHIKALFDENQNPMRIQMANLFSGVNSDPGVWSSFSQLYNLFYGIRDIKQKEPYYQAISAMLIPFGNTPKSSKLFATLPGITYSDIQRTFAWFSKQARNYCAHNMFGTSVANNTAVFVIMGALSAVLNETQRSDFDNWFHYAWNEFKKGSVYSISKNIEKIDGLKDRLYEKGLIKTKNGDPIIEYTATNKPVKFLQALGYNTQMDLQNESSSTVREDYYVFTLAAYTVKWFKGLSEQEVKNRFGAGIELLYRLANEIVDAYNYPKQM